MLYPSHNFVAGHLFTAEGRRCLDSRSESGMRMLFGSGMTMCCELGMTMFFESGMTMCFVS